MNVNVNGVLYAAQAVGRQMARLGIPGSIILIASMSGSVYNKVRWPALDDLLGANLYPVSSKGHHYVSYGTSKSAVLQMARSMACELGPMNIRVNSISPGYMVTKYVNRSRLRSTRINGFTLRMTGSYLSANPELIQTWSEQNPLGRLGRPYELRGVVTWLASDASSFCTGSEWAMILYFESHLTELLNSIIIDGGHTAW